MDSAIGARQLSQVWRLFNPQSAVVASRREAEVSLNQEGASVDFAHAFLNRSASIRNRLSSLSQSVIE